MVSFSILFPIIIGILISSDRSVEAGFTLKQALVCTGLFLNGVCSDAGQGSKGLSMGGKQGLEVVVHDQRLGLKKRSNHHENPKRNRLLRKNMEKAVSELTDEDWKMAEDYTDIQIRGDKDLENRIRNFVVNYGSKLDMEDPNIQAKLQNSVNDLTTGEEEEENPSFLNRKIYGLHPHEIAAGLVLVGIVFYLLANTPPDFIDKKYYHPDQDPDMRPGETESQRLERLENVRKTKMRWYDRENAIYASIPSWDNHHGNNHNSGENHGNNHHRVVNHHGNHHHHYDNHIHHDTHVGDVFHHDVPHFDFHW